MFFLLYNSNDKGILVKNQRAREKSGGWEK